MLLVTEQRVAMSHSRGESCDLPESQETTGGVREGMGLGGDVTILRPVSRHKLPA